MSMTRLRPQPACKLSQDTLLVVLGLSCATMVYLFILLLSIRIRCFRHALFGRNSITSLLLDFENCIFFSFR